MKSRILEVTIFVAILILIATSGCNEEQTENIEVKRETRVWCRTPGKQISSPPAKIPMDFGITTTEFVKSIYGVPNDINRTIDSWGVHEQWVYEKIDVYFYFEDGILTSLQD